MANMNLDKVKARIFVNGYLIEDDDIDLYTINMSTGCISGNFIGYGATYSPSCEITMSETDMFNIGDRVTVQFYLDGEWVTFGSYVLVDEPVTEEGTTTIRLEGHLSTTFESEMVSFSGEQLFYGIKILDAIDLISTQTGVIVNLYGYDDIYQKIVNTVISIPSYDASTNEIKAIRISCREFVAGLSLLLGGNAIERNGQVYITGLNSLYDYKTVFTEDDYSTLKRSKKGYTPDSVILSYQPYIGRGDGALVYTPGDKLKKEMVRNHVANEIPYTINVECDWIGYNARNGFLTQSSFGYNPAEVEFPGYHPSLYAGNEIRVSEGDNKYYIMCGIVEYEWDGGLTTKVSSVFSAENNQANTSISTSSNVATYSQIIAQLNDVMTFKGIYTDFVDTKAVTTDTLSAKVAEIDSLEADSAIIKNIFSESIISDKAILDVLQAKVVDANVVKAAVAEVGYLTADEANLVYATINSLEAEKARISVLEADNATINGKLSAIEVEVSGKLNANELSAEVAKLGYATIENLNTQTARIDELKASALTANSAVITELKSGVADINTLIFGSAAGGTIQTEFANSVIAQLGQAQIKSAMIESVSAGKITAGTIYTDDVTIQSKSGNMILSDNTIQISDGTRARVQIGKDASNDYSINIWDESGNLMFSKGGITDSAIKSAIIRNDMVSENANISASKLDIDSLFTVINEDNSHTLKSTKIYLDDKSQTLDVSFKEMSTYVDNLQKIQSTQGTQISTIQGKINSKVWQQDITTAVNDLEIGGRNLLKNSATYDFRTYNLGGTFVQSIVNDTSALSGKHTEIKCNAEGTGFYSYPCDNSTIGKVYTWSFWGKCSVAKSGTVGHERGGRKTISLTTEWQKFSHTYTVNSSETHAFTWYLGWKVGEILYIKDFKFEEGNRATTWTPAPEDTEEKITELNTKYTEVKQTADGLSTTVASHTTQLQSVENQVTTNLLKPTLATTTLNGVTCTANTDENGNFDGTYTLNGTASANASFYFISSKNALGLSNFVGKKLKLLGNPVIGDTNCRLVAVNSSWGADATDVGNGSVFTLAETTKMLYIDIKSGFVCDNLVFKPMITTNLNADYSMFVPHTGSTGSLNGDLANNSKMTEYTKTVATQTAEKFSWLVKSGTSSTNFTLTDRVASLLSEKFNIDALTTFKNSAENGTSTVINGGAIKAKTIKAESIDVDSIFAQNISAKGTITGGSFVGSSFEGATGSFTGSVTATSGKIGFMDVTSTDIALDKGDKYGEFTLSNEKYIKMATYDDNGAGYASYLSFKSFSMSKKTQNGMGNYRQYGIDVTPSEFLMRNFNTSGGVASSTSIKPGEIATKNISISGDVKLTSGESMKTSIQKSVRAYELTIGDITINSGNPFFMSLASILSSLRGNLVGACLKKCWPHSSWAFSNTLLLNGTDLYISTTTTQVYTVSVVIFYTLG